MCVFFAPGLEFFTKPCTTFPSEEMLLFIDKHSAATKSRWVLSEQSRSNVLVLLLLFLKSLVSVRVIQHSALYTARTQSTARRAEHSTHSTHSTRTARTAHAQHTHIPYRTLTARRAHAEHAQHSTVHIAQQNGTANSSRTRHHYASSL